ncbi:hypothetical protein [Jiulongibacter sediminis]|jgi:hypothetical protein|uniref:hypothetical protein n=1 Tax=Jiulongibacter sediminis TaxID=1605367 RepID=UPI0026F14DD1|nr:hypothetical protein [Jiulongibacter sediminis]
MLKAKFIALYYAFKIMTCSCNSEVSMGFVNLRAESKIEKLGKLPEIIDESSGLALLHNGNILTHNDDGEPALFEIETSGKLISKKIINGTQNTDWEDLTTDPENNIYIGNFGNNFQNRKDLRIFKYNPSNSTESITFRYADQSQFPAPIKNFDCEAFFWHNGELHLFTKSWEKKNPISKHYSLPDKAGEYTLRLQEDLPIQQPVTAADISPNGKFYALLTYGKILFFEVKNDEINFKYPLGCIKTRRKQTEALTFISDKEILFSNEQGDLYKVTFDLP